MKNIALLITSTFSILTIAILVMLSLEKPSSEFSNYNELAASGLIEKGWVTKYIPKSSKNIKEQHNLDTNTVNVFFEYSSNEKEKSFKECNLIVSNEIGKKYICPPFEGQTSVLILQSDGTGRYQSHGDGLQ